jgi:hypothetical protein
MRYPGSGSVDLWRKRPYTLLAAGMMASTVRFHRYEYCINVCQRFGIVKL